MRRLAAAVLSLVLAGLEPAGVWAQFRVDSAAARPAVPGGTAGAGSARGPIQSTSLLPASVSLNGPLSLAPLPAVNAVTDPKTVAAKASFAPAAAALAATVSLLPAAPAPAARHAAPAALAPAARTAPAVPSALQDFRQAAQAKNGSGRPVSAEAAVGDSRVQFDGAARRPDAAAAVSGRPLQASRSGLTRARPLEESLAFSNRFLSVVQHRSKFKGKERWDAGSWERLRRDLERFLTGQPSSAVLTKRGPAAEAGVFKFKWGDQGLRIFAHWDVARGRLTVLDLRAKEELLAVGEDRAYARLAERVRSGAVDVAGPEGFEAALAKLGRLRPGLAAEPVFKTPRTDRGWNAVSEEAAEPAGEPAAPAPAPLLEGTLDPATLKLPFALRARRVLALGAHYAFLAAAPVILGIGLGVLPLAVGVGAAVVRAVSARRAAANGSTELNETDLRRTRELLLRMRRGEALSQAERAFLERGSAPFEQLLGWGEATVDYLTGRMGVDPQRAPRLWIDESSHDLHWAASVGGRLDKSGAIYLGVGFLLRPLERAVGVLAHEMGHLFFGDKGWLRERLRMRGGLEGGFKTGMTDAGTLASGALLSAALFAADPTLLLTGLAWAAVALASAAAALLAGLAATRQDELRADHFSAWLTDPAWLAAYLRDEAGHGRAPRGRFERWRAHLLSTHPAWETRVERLAAFGPRPAASPEAVLPVSDSPWGLSGELSAVVSGADESIGAALAEEAAGAYDFRLYQGAAGTLVVRAHPAAAARVSDAADPAFDALLAVVLSKYPGARVESSRAAAHPVLETLKESALGRELLAELSAEPISVRWEGGWPADAARAALVVSGPRPDAGKNPASAASEAVEAADAGKNPASAASEAVEAAEIVLNAAVFWKASPKAAAAALAHELFHYRVLRGLRAAGIDWMDLGGMEFERLAQGVGYRVFAELGGEVSDDVALPSGGNLFADGLKRWSRSAPSDDVEYLRQHGYAPFRSLAELEAQGAEAVALELGRAADEVRAQLAAARALHDSEARRERAWAWSHPLSFLSVRFAR